MQAGPDRISEQLVSWISRVTNPEAVDWLKDQRSTIQSGEPGWTLFTSFSGVPRYTGKRDLELSDDDLARAGDLRTGWNPRHWTVDQAGRTVIILALPQNDSDYLSRLDQIFETADVGELVALYQALPLLPHPEKHRARAAEGVRSNMTSVFEAIVLRNPYLAEYADEGQWNQAVLKALFVGSPLHPIHGLDDRANPTLARMLVDFAQERWAASRPVPPELWRPVGSFIDDQIARNLARAFDDDDPVQQKAAALALAQSSSAGARRILNTRSDLKEKIDSGILNWDTLLQDTGQS